MRKSILIVDHSTGVRGLLRTYFSAQPEYEICGEAVDGLDAIAKARDLKPDLMILDFSMPRMNGLEAAAVLQDIVPHAAIILFTLYADLLGPKKAALAGINSVVPKTGKLDDLLKEVQRLLAPA